MVKDSYFNGDEDVCNMFNIYDTVAELCIVTSPFILYIVGAR